MDFRGDCILINKGAMDKGPHISLPDILCVLRLNGSRQQGCVFLLWSDNRSVQGTIRKILRLWNMILMAFRFEVEVVHRGSPSKVFGRCIAAVDDDRGHPPEG